jgi:hypothetical protein
MGSVIRVGLPIAACLLWPAQGIPGGPGEAGDPGLIISHRAPSDWPPSADPEAPAWKGSTGVWAEKDRRGEIVPGHRTEIRSRWTTGNLYLLFVCPYEELYLKPNASPSMETDRLWEWDVAEAFIGTDFENIERYTEFEVSPQGEWVDLMIDLSARPASYDRKWDSGFQAKARIDRARAVWYGEMRIPMDKIDRRPPRAGQEMRINFYRIQGPPAKRKWINWQPVNRDAFHTPAAFGRMRLEQ